MTDTTPPLANETRGEYIHTIRALAGLSARKLDGLAGVAIGTTAHIEAGKRTNIGDDTYSRVATALNLDPAVVLALPVQAPAGAEAPPASAGGEALAFVPPGQIDRSDINPRRTFDPDAIAALADSIVTHGIVQPVMLRPRHDAPGRYWLVAGERRWRAASGLVMRGLLPADFAMPARIRDMTDREHREIALIENMQRADVPPMEEAEAIAALVQDHGGDTAAAATAIGKTGRSGQRFVQIAVSLCTRLTEEARDALRNGTINKEMGRQLTLVSDAKRQAELLAEVAEGKIATGKQMRARINHGLFPAECALFGRLEYNGPVEQDLDTEKVFFTDLALVKRLQLDAIKVRAKELRGEGYPVVLTLTGDYDYGWEPAGFKARQDGYYPLDRAHPLPAGHQRAAALVLQRDLSVVVFTDMAKVPDGKALTVKEQAKTAAKAAGDPLADLPTGARLYARNARTMALQRALWSEPGNPTLLAHLCLSLMGGMGEGADMLAVRPEHRSPDVRVVDGEVSAALADFITSLEWEERESLFAKADPKSPYPDIRSEAVGQYGASRKRIAARVLARLHEMDAGSLFKLAMALLAARCGTWLGSDAINDDIGLGDKPEVLAAAARLRLDHADTAPCLSETYLSKLPGPALDRLASDLTSTDLLSLQYFTVIEPWEKATATTKRAALRDWLADHPEKAGHVPPLFRFASSADTAQAIRGVANDVRDTPAAAE